MRVPLVFCAVSLVCSACVAGSGEAEPAPSGVSFEDVARQLARRVASTERLHLQTWCAEDGRTDSDVALRVVDAREPAGETAAVLCEEIMAMGPSVPGSAEEVGEAQQGLTPFGWGCAAAGVTLAFTSGDFCERHPEVKDCTLKFKLGSFGLGAMCFFFF